MPWQPRPQIEINLSKTNLIQTQAQTQTQVLTPQQLLVAQLLELPVEALRERVETEMLENPTLEKDTDKEGFDADPVLSSSEDSESYNSYDAQADYQPDDIPEYLLRDTYSSEEPTTREWGENQSFHDLLTEQIGYLELDSHQRQLLEYLIGSLGNDGLLHIPLQQLADELEVYHNIPTTLPQLEQALHRLQQFEPAGVGARSLQECLLLQVQRMPGSHTQLKALLTTLLKQHFDLLMLKRWDRIQQRMHLTHEQLAALRHQVRHLNPRPGSSLGEVLGHNFQQITPDFIVEITVPDTSPSGSPTLSPSSSESVLPSPRPSITLSLNNADVPPLRVNPSDLNYVNSLSGPSTNPLNRLQREGLTYMRAKVEKAQLFIQAIQQRRTNMLATMQTIIQLQRPFFETGDEALLRPMRLEDIAQHTGLALSTISRVTNSKYVQTPYGIHPLRWFFTSKAHLDGDEVSVRNIKNTLSQLISNEDPQQPLSDLQLTQLLARHGYKIARRTVAKYREQLNIPVARLRKV